MSVTIINATCVDVRKQRRIVFKFIILLTNAETGVILQTTRYSCVQSATKNITVNMVITLLGFKEKRGTYSVWTLGPSILSILPL